MKIYFFSTKQERSEGNQKRVVYAREGRFSYLCVLLRFGNTLRLTPSSASPLPSLMKRMHSYKNLPYNKIGHTHKRLIFIVLAYQGKDIVFRFIIGV
jgi:hypothetical protein